MNKDFNSDYLRGHIDTIILKSLFDGEKYGYEICKDIETKSEGSFILKQPSLYSALKRLESSGLITSRWQDSEIGGKRHYYSLTDEGVKHYEETQAEWNYSYNILHSLLSDTKDVKNDDTTANQEIADTEKNDAEFINDASKENETTIQPTEEPSSTSFADNSSENEETSAEDDNFNQLNFFPDEVNIQENTEQLTQLDNIEPQIEPEITTTNEPKNDAEFINETIIDEDNDVSFSNNVYFRVKNDLQKINAQSNSQGSEIISTAQKTQSPQEVKYISKTPSPIFNFDNYEIKPYAKHNIRGKKTEYIKKSKFYLVLSLMVSLIMLAQALALAIAFKGLALNSTLTKPFIITFFAVAALILLLGLINFLINPYKKGTIRVKNQFLIKSILTIVLVSTLLTLNIFLKNFGNVQIYTTLLIPIVFILNIIFEEIIYNILKNNLKFKA